MIFVVIAIATMFPVFLATLLIPMIARRREREVR